MTKPAAPTKPPTRTDTMEVVDLVSDARQKCLAVDVLVKLLVTAAQTKPTDERVMVLVYTVEDHMQRAWDAVERASKALR